MVFVRDSSGALIACYTVKQVAKYFNVSESTVRKWVKDNKLKAFRMFFKWYFEPSHVKMFADERLKKNEN